MLAPYPFVLKGRKASVYERTQTSAELASNCFNEVLDLIHHVGNILSRNFIAKVTCTKSGGELLVLCSMQLVFVAFVTEAHCIMRQ